MDRLCKLLYRQSCKMGTLSKPQLKVMTTLLITILILCGKVNFTNLSRYSPLSEKTYRCFFAKIFMSSEK